VLAFCFHHAPAIIKLLYELAANVLDGIIIF